MINIGVTGHRYLTDFDRLNPGVDAAIAAIRAAYPGQALRLISPLAEGADRLVVERAMAAGAQELVVVFPLPPDDYRRDFITPESQKEFDRWVARARGSVLLPAMPTRDEAYLAVGRFVVQHCAVLVAVWDGQPAQGTGGVGDVVAEARAIRKPLAWVRAGNRLAGTTQPTSLGELQGALVCENFPSS